MKIGIEGSKVLTNRALHPCAEDVAGSVRRLQRRSAGFLSIPRMIL